MANKPKKTRDERYEELRKLLTTREGTEVLRELFNAIMGKPNGPIGPRGLMIKTILYKEYPEG